MDISSHTAPSLATLRPGKPVETATFPVYKNLTDTLVKAPVPDVTVRHVLGVCAGYSYSDGATVAMIMARMGLVDNRCVTVNEYVDAMFINSTAHIVQSADGRVVILSYRGTPPMSAITWLTDADVYPDKLRLPEWSAATGALVHEGFYRNVRATRYAVVQKLLDALAGKSIIDGSATQPLEALYITGHSLGAAMAALMLIMVQKGPAYAELAKRLRGSYTYGQPMIGNRALATACDADDEISSKIVRYVYRHDAVPQLPPSESGDFAHFGTEYDYAGDVGEGGAWVLQKKPTAQVRDLLLIAGAPLAFVARLFKQTRDITFRASLDDHGPQHYITALQPPDVLSEFGD